VYFPDTLQRCVRPDADLMAPLITPLAEQHMRNTTSTPLCTSLVLLASVILSGCGSGVSGTYTSDGDGMIEKMEFKSGGKVEITAMGQTKEGTYEVENKKVKVTIGGETNILTINDKGCLDGGGFIGTLCKK
jgi:hypothetical protein